MNIFQRYIKELLDEFGPLLQHQLEELVRHKTGIPLPNLDGYISQMCQFDDYVKTELYGEFLVSLVGAEPDFDIIRSIKVMLCFIDNLVDYCKGSEHSALMFIAVTDGAEKDLCVIPVKKGMEHIVSAQVDNAYKNPGTIIIFLLDDKEQMKHINTERPCKFAIIAGQDVTFYTKNIIQQEE